MNKSMLLASVVAVLSISGGAMALEEGKEKDLKIPGFHGPNASLGTVIPVAAGRDGNFCLYTLLWESPYNRNDIVQCDIKEYRTVVDPSCIRNEERDFVTSILAGGDFGTYCDGFNVKGEKREDVKLVWGEDYWGINGVVIFDGSYPSVFPVKSENK